MDELDKTVAPGLWHNDETEGTRRLAGLLNLEYLILYSLEVREFVTSNSPGPKIAAQSTKPPHMQHTW